MTGPAKLPSSILIGFSVTRGPTSTRPKASGVTFFLSGLGTTYVKLQIFTCFHGNFGQLSLLSLTAAPHCDADAHLLLSHLTSEIVLCWERILSCLSLPDFCHTS